MSEPDDTKLMERINLTDITVYRSEDSKEGRTLFDEYKEKMV